METKIKEILLKTQTIINDSGISQEFKQAAFQEVFRVLLETGVRFEGKSFPSLLADTKEEVSLPLGREKRVKSTPSPRSSISPAKLIDELIQKKFFSEKRRDIDCIKELTITKGIKVSRKQMATILVRKLRSGSLKREKTEEGYVYFVQ